MPDVAPADCDVAGRETASSEPGLSDGLSPVDQRRQVKGCRWCRKEFTPAQASQEFCGKRCRQTAWRIRGKRSVSPSTSTTPEFLPGGVRVVYADPPYPGRAFLYKDQPTYGGEVDHQALLSGLEQRRLAGDIAGWALSTSKRGLRLIIERGWLPPEADWAPWVKPLQAKPDTRGVHSRHEYVVFVPARHATPGVQDFLYAAPARLGGQDLVGRKPITFCAWLFDLLGMVPGDALEDMFPGTGVVGDAWRELGAVAGALEAPMSQRHLLSQVLKQASLELPATEGSP